MALEIKKLKRKDFNQARKFAVEGMNLSWYTSNAVELYFYSQYFWYLEISKATRALGAYQDDELVGVLLADIFDEPKVYQSLGAKLFIRLVDFVINIGYGSVADEYEKANKAMLKEFKQTHTPDGELNFFAVNPEITGQGIGTKLLNTFEQLEANKLIYLYTDTGSTYQFYEHKGFNKEGRREINLEVADGQVPLTCFLFSKKLNQ